MFGRNLVLYWRAQEPGQKVAVPISLVAAIPGNSTGPASRAYHYYTDEQRVWIGPLRLTITPVRGRYAWSLPRLSLAVSWCGPGW